MQQLQLAIQLSDGQTLHGLPRPEDDGRLAELLGDRATVELASSGDDLEGHSMSADVLVDVEGHAIAIRLPNPEDAARLRRALAVGAVTATIVGAGAIAALQSPAQTPAAVVPAPAAENVRTVPAPAVRAQEAEMLRQQQLADEQQLLVVPVTVDADNPAVPAPALRAQEAEMSGQVEAVPVAPLVQADNGNPAVPAQAQHALDAELERQRQLTDE